MSEKSLVILFHAQHQRLYTFKLFYSILLSGIKVFDIFVLASVKWDWLSVHLIASIIIHDPKIRF